ncbi:MAG TPA: indole-3-glycerol phosphate synthase TrpC [Bacteroidota bacterium]|nr:indole-3-glycerol phosphate synthase TrpC [Bacteroidota bacterium]
MNILSEIISTKREEVGFTKTLIPRSQLRKSEYFYRSCISLYNALVKNDMAVIAEVKKASPSKGIIRADFDPVAIANSYSLHGASAISVLTDEKYFQGRLEYLTAIRKSVDLPILRKDFIIDSYQLPEAKAAGADAILLIVAALEKSQLQELHLEANELGLDVLVEVHNEKEIDVLDFDLVKLIGINNRDLTTFNVDLQTSFRLRNIIPSHIPVISESGIKNATDIRSLMEHDVHAVLIGETLMRTDDPGKALRQLLGEVHGP